MIIVNLTGGLGNQMFQYAFGRNISIQRKTELKIHFTNALFYTQRYFCLDSFKINAKKATKNDLAKLGIIKNRVLNRFFYLVDERLGIQLNKNIVTQRFPLFFNHKYLSTKNDTYIQGYWADYKYFQKIENIIRNEFLPKKRLDYVNLRTLNYIKNSNSVSIHVRRGDYVNSKTDKNSFLVIRYYANCIAEINKKAPKPVFFIFSDDIPWCKKNLDPLLQNHYYIDNNKGEDSYKDLFLMSNCHHNIIAKSTFSWWGAFLNKNKKKIILSPNES